MVALPAVLVSEKFVTPKLVLIVALPALLWSWNSIVPLLVMLGCRAARVEEIRRPTVIDRCIAGGAPLEEIHRRPTIIIDGRGCQPWSRRPPKKVGEKLQFRANSLKHRDRCVISRTRTSKENKPIGIRTGETCRKTCSECAITCGTPIIEIPMFESSKEAVIVALPAVLLLWNSMKPPPKSSFVSTG